MSHGPFDPPADPVTSACARAAGLLLLAVHTLDDTDILIASSTAGAQLACLAAVEVLAEPPVTAQPAAGHDAETLIRAALTVLADLPQHAFADHRVLTGCAHARRALLQAT
ncbi:hypothetical protein [uncultured Jatrophihabitans sp.]|uniref:hypothetical protein n=1 Tax=uncultured Jatrophihabitans sp. TaxID=1610747 RepID=UPI0035C97DEE